MIHKDLQEEKTPEEAAEVIAENLKKKGYIVIDKRRIIEDIIAIRKRIKEEEVSKEFLKKR